MQNTTTHQSATGAQQHWNQLPMYASAHQRPTAANPRAYTAADYNSPAEPRRDDATSQLYGADQASSYNNYSSGYNGLNNVGSYNYASTGYSSAGSPSTARRTSGQKPSTSTPPASAPITGAANPSPASRYYPSAQQGTTETTQYQPSSAPPQVGHHQNHPYQSSYYNNYYDQSQIAQQYQGHSYQSSTPSSQPSASQHQYPSYNQRTQQWQQQPQTGYPSMQSVPQYGWQQAQQQQQWNTPQYGYPPATPQSAAQPQHSQPQGHHNTIPPLSASVVPPAQIQTTGTPSDQQTGKKPKTPSSGKRPAESGTDEEAAPAKPKKSKKAAAAAAVEEKPVPKPPSKSHLNPPRQAQSAWQLFFTDELNKAKAASVQGSSPGGTPHHAKLNVAQIAKDAGLAYANLSDEQKVYYAAKVQESKDEYARELAIWHTTLTPEDIRLENAFRAQQRKDGKSRKGNLKDPNAPKKPLSAYFLFLKGIREDDALRARVWGVESETTKQSVLAAERWRNLSDVDKKPFLAQAEKDKQEYEVSRKLYEDEAAARARGEDIPLRIYAPISIDPAPRLVLRDVEKKEADGATAATTVPIASSTPAETSPHGSQDSFHGFIDGRLTDIDLGGFQDVTAKGTGEQGDWGELTQLMGPADGVNTGPDVGSILPTPVSADSTYQQGYDGVKQENTIQPGFEEAAKAGQPMSFDIGSAAESVNDVANPGNAPSTSTSSNSGSSLVSSNSGSHGDAAAQGDGSADVTAAPATTNSLESAAPAADGV